MQILLSGHRGGDPWRVHAPEQLALTGDKGQLEADHADGAERALGRHQHEGAATDDGHEQVERGSVIEEVRSGRED